MAKKSKIIINHSFLVIFTCLDMLHLKSRNNLLFNSPSDPTDTQQNTHFLLQMIVVEQILMNVLCFTCDHCECVGCSMMLQKHFSKDTITSSAACLRRRILFFFVCCIWSTVCAHRSTYMGAYTSTHKHPPSRCFLCPTHSSQSESWPWLFLITVQTGLSLRVCTRKNSWHYSEIMLVYSGQILKAVFLLLMRPNGTSDSSQ